MTDTKTLRFIQGLDIHPTDIIAIDGPCGSGKTTLAESISSIYDIDIIHMDDFFLPLELRTPQRLAECGGNIHYERFSSQIINGIQSQKPFTYQKFNCSTMDYAYNIEIKNNKPIVIEGSYSLRPDFRSIYTKKIYLEVDAHIQKQRLIQRVGLESYQQFVTLWIPKESAYFQHFHIRDCADIIL